MERSHQPCPHPDCSSSDAFSYNEEKMVGNCMSCSQAYPMRGVVYETEWLDRYPLKNLRNHTPMTTPTPLHQVRAQVHRGDRGISEETMRFYDVKTSVDSEGKSIEHIYTYPSGGRKIRTLPKTFRSDGGRMDELFGMDKWNAGCAKAVTITEGELDAMSAYQMLGSKYPVVSLPSANPSKKLFENCREWLSSFEKIYVSLDNDGKADGFAVKLANIFPNRVYRVPHDKFKDANEFLVAGELKSYQSAWWNAQKYVPENVFNTTEQFLKIYDMKDDSAYIPTGIEAFDSVALGLMQGHWTVFQAPEGIGKTELMRMLEWNLIKNHPDVPIAICHMEETKKRTMLGLVSYDLDEDVTRMDLINEKGLDSKVRDSIVGITKTENLYQFSIGVDDDPMTLLDKVRFFSEACGCKYLFFEPIQDLGYSRMTEETLEAFLSGLSTKLARLSAELNIGIVSVAHENDDGAIRDCRMIGKRASVVVKLARNKLAETEDERNITTLTVVKNRPASKTGFAGTLRFHPESFTLKEVYE